MKPRFLIAKYIPEIIRNEPRNFGILLWTPWGVSAQFLGEKNNGSIDARTIPGWVSSKVSYKEWVYYWRKSINSKSLKNPDEIRKMAKEANGNYMLCDGGEVIQDVEESDVCNLLTFLFDTLVDTE